MILTVDPRFVELSIGRRRIQRAGTCAIKHHGFFLTENEKIEDNFLNQYSEIFLQGNNHFGSDEFLLNLS